MEFFLWNIILGAKLLYNITYIRLHVPVDMIRIYAFNFRFISSKSQSQQKQAKKTHFTIHFHSENLIYLMNLNLNLNGNENNMLPQHNRNPFHFKNFAANLFLFGVRKKFAEMLQYHILTPRNCNNSWNTLKANVCMFLYVSV